jgi:hypothetical protein
VVLPLLTASLVTALEVTGSVYFSLGCTLAISLFPPGVAMTSILYLVLGAPSGVLPAGAGAGAGAGFGVREREGDSVGTGL